MASVCSDKGGTKRVTFKGLDGKRRAIYLGAVGKPVAENIRLHIDAILVAAASKTPVDQKTALWLGGISDDWHDKLVKVGLANHREVTGKSAQTVIGPFIDGYLSKRSDIKQSTRLVIGHAIRNLKGFFGEDRPMETVTPAECDDFRRWLETSEKLAPATIGKRIEWADAFFRDAFRRKLIAENPFEGVRRPKASNPERQRYISRETINKVIEACPDREWRLLVSMSRFLGLRTPSEPFTLTWNDVDWAKSRIRVTNVKTARYDGRASRWVPILPEVRVYLDEVPQSVTRLSLRPCENADR